MQKSTTFWAMTAIGNQSEGVLMVKCNVYICPKVVLNFKKSVNSPFKDLFQIQTNIKCWNLSLVCDDLLFLGQTFSYKQEKITLALKGEFTDFLKFNTTLGHIYTSHFTIKTPSDRFRMAVMAQNVVLFCTLLSLHKEKTRTTNIK